MQDVVVPISDPIGFGAERFRSIGDDRVFSIVDLIYRVASVREAELAVIAECERVVKSEHRLDRGVGSIDRAAGFLGHATPRATSQHCIERNDVLNPATDWM